MGRPWLPGGPLRGRRLAAVNLALATMVVSACGLAPHDRPRALPANLSLRLDEPAVNPTIACPRTPAAAAQAVIFLVRTEGGANAWPPELRPVERQVPGSADLCQVLLSLLKGPSPDEVRERLGSEVRPDFVAAPPSADGNVAHVDLRASSFGVAPWQKGVVAVGQIVYTLTEVPGIDSVTFSLGGKPLQPFRLDGSLVEGPLQRSDFPALFPA